LDTIDAEVEAMIDTAVTEARTAANPNPATLITDIYVNSRQEA
jgi:TPP-dependent pyruvate/acetoin dehydrogenase alpha subunit